MKGPGAGMKNPSDALSTAGFRHWGRRDDSRGLYPRAARGPPFFVSVFKVDASLGLGRGQMCVA